MKRFLPVVLLPALLLAASTSSARPLIPHGTPPTTPLNFACALKKNGSLRYVTATSECRKKEDAVMISPGPVYVCVQADGSSRKVASPACPAPGTLVTLPGNNDEYFCAGVDGRLTHETSPGNCGAQTEVVVTHTNSPPTDIGLAPSSVDENLPSGTTVGTLSSTDPNNGDTFTYTFAGGSDDGQFTITGNTLQTAASFNYEVKSSYQIKVRSTDQGNLFFEKTFTIQVNNVNEPPVNTVPGAQAVNEDTNLTFTGGTAISIGDPDAGSNPVRVSLDVLHGTLTLPATTGLTFVDATANGMASVHFIGTIANINSDLNGLVYKGVANYNSTRFTATPETLTVVTNDQGNTGSGGALSDTDTVAITVNAVNDAPTIGNYNPGANVVQANMKNTSLVLPLSGASDPDTGDGGYTASFTVGTVSATSPAGGTITVTNSSTGAIDFDPPPGATGNVTFTYTVCDSGNPTPPQCSAAATATINVQGPVVWFVNSALGSNGTGTLTNPFNVLSSADAVDAGNQGIFLYSGTYTTGITLNSSERLVGQPVTAASFDAAMGVSPPAGTIARPAIGTGSVTVQGTVTVASSDIVRVQTISTGASTGLTGASGATGVDVSQTSVTTTTGTAISLTNAQGSYAFPSVSTNGAANGIVLDTLGTSSVTVSGGSIVNASTRGIDVSSGTGNYTFANTITTTAAGRSVEVTNHTGGTVAFNGAITDSGLGINLGTNSGGTINFTGGLTLSTGVNTAFNATGGGTVNVTGSANTLTTTTGIALNVTSTSIGASGLTFRSIASNGAASGIVLNTTGSSGGLTVSGNGSTGTGGTIQNSTAAGVVLMSTTSPNLSWMNIQNSGDDGIHGESVTGLTLDRDNVNSNGNSTSDDGIQLGLESGSTVGVTGAVSITNSSVSGNAHNNVHIRDTSGTISSLTVTGSTFSNINDTTGANSFLFEGSGTSTLTSATMSGNTFGNNSPQRALEVQAHDTATVSGLVIQTNTFSDSGIGASFTQDGSANLQYKFLSNTMTNPQNPTPGTTFGQYLQQVNVFSSSQSTGGSIQGRISSNTIGTAGVPNSGSATGMGIRIFIQGKTQGILLLNGNTIREVGTQGGNRGIDAEFVGVPTPCSGPVPTSSITVTNNNVDTQAPASTFPLAAIYIAGDNQGCGGITQADIFGPNIVPTAGSYDWPTFDGNGGQLIFDEVSPGGDSRLVGVAATAQAQLTNTNTGKSYAPAGVQIIPGPIPTPP